MIRGRKRGRAGRGVKPTAPEARLVKEIAVHGRSKIMEVRRDGVVQSYWTTTRFQTRGRGPYLAWAYATIKDRHSVPRQRYVKVSASEFIAHPKRYAQVQEEGKPLLEYKLKRGSHS
jgi:hypothetical protein